MRNIQEIKQDQMKLCYDFILEKQAFDIFVKLIDARVEEIEYALINNRDDKDGYEVYKHDVLERTVTKGILDMIQQGAEAYNNNLKEHVDE